MSGQYFDQPSAESQPAETTLHLPEGDLVLRTDRGVFSRGHVDAATRMLIARAPAPPASGRFLDLGCGYGPIALALALRCPDAEVWAVDVNERACALTSHNASANGLANVRVAAPAGVPDDLRFDLIWSNPPIRIGKSALHDLLLGWLGRLTPDGRAVLVVGKNLGADSLATWLTAQGFPVERLASSQGFRLLEVRARPG